MQESSEVVPDKSEWPQKPYFAVLFINKPIRTDQFLYHMIIISTFNKFLGTSA